MARKEIVDEQTAFDVSIICPNLITCTLSSTKSILISIKLQKAVVCCTLQKRPITYPLNNYGSSSYGKCMDPTLRYIWKAYLEYPQSFGNWFGGFENAMEWWHPAALQQDLQCLQIECQSVLFQCFVQVYLALDIPSQLGRKLQVKLHKIQCLKALYLRMPSTLRF